MIAMVIHKLYMLQTSDNLTVEIDLLKIVSHHRPTGTKIGIPEQIKMIDGSVYEIAPREWDEMMDTLSQAVRHAD